MGLVILRTKDKTAVNKGGSYVRAMRNSYSLLPISNEMEWHSVIRGTERDCH